MVGSSRWHRKKGANSRARPRTTRSAFKKNRLFRRRWNAELCIKRDWNAAPCDEKRSNRNSNSEGLTRCRQQFPLAENSDDLFRVLITQRRRFRVICANCLPRVAILVHLLTQMPRSYVHRFAWFH